VHARLVAGTTISSNICDFTEATKCDAERLAAQRRAIPAGKEPSRLEKSRLSAPAE